MSIEKMILMKIRRYKKGKIFFSSDFYDFNDTAAVRKALSRIEKKGKIIRLAQGIYLTPIIHKSLGVLMPEAVTVAQAIAKRDKARIIPTGVYALNKLGFSTQVPLNVVFLTDGSPRTIKIGKQTIKFKIISPKLLHVKSEILLLIIQSLKQIGERSVTEAMESKIKELIKHENKKIIKHDLRLAPRWIGVLINELMKI
jgi:predicted transcriptional regulator of viral defense system